MFREIGLLLLALTGLLSGCDQIRSLMPVPDVPPAISLKREELLKAVLFNSPTKGARSMRVSVGSGKEKFEGLVLMNPKEVVQIDSNHAVLVTENVPLDDEGRKIEAHAFGALIGAYFFNKTKDQNWQLNEIINGVDSIGVFGSIGKTTIHKLSDAHFALTVQNGSCWQGHCPSWISIYGIKVNQMMTYLPIKTISVTNTGASPEVCQNIESAIQSGQNVITKPSFELESRDRNCTNIEGSYQIKITRNNLTKLTIRFSGYEAEWTQKTNAFNVEKINTMNEYELIDGKFKLTRGVDPLDKESRKI